MVADTPPENTHDTDDESLFNSDFNSNTESENSSSEEETDDDFGNELHCICIIYTSIRIMK